MEKVRLEFAVADIKLRYLIYHDGINGLQTCTTGRSTENIISRILGNIEQREYARIKFALTLMYKIRKKIL